MLYIILLPYLYTIKLKQQQKNNIMTTEQIQKIEEAKKRLIHLINIDKAWQALTPTKRIEIMNIVKSYHPNKNANFLTLQRACKSYFEQNIYNK